MSASFNESGKKPFSIQLLTMTCSNLEQRSELRLRTFAGIFLKVVAFLGSSLLISLSICSNDTFWNFKWSAFWAKLRIFLILG